MITFYKRYWRTAFDIALIALTVWVIMYVFSFLYKIAAPVFMSFLIFACIEPLAKRLNRIGIEAKLLELGAEPGDAVAIGSGAVAEDLSSVAIGKDTTTTHAQQVAVGARDVEVQDPTRGVILRSPNGTRYRLTVGDDGVLSTTSIGPA